MGSNLAKNSPIAPGQSQALSQAAFKPLKEGDRVPNVIFKARVRDESIGGENPFKWKDVSTNDLFANKRVVLFALPGGKI